MNAKWTGKEDAQDGYGQFETDGPLIHFDSFTEFFYLERLLLLSALESWSFSTGQQLPDYLHDRLCGVVDVLRKEALK